MIDWRLLELEHELRQIERRQRRLEPLPPGNPSLGARARERLAHGLVGLGLRLDAEASRAAVGSIDATTRLNGNHV